MSETRLNHKTYISVGLVVSLVGVIGVLFVSSVRTAAEIGRMTQKFDDIERRLSRIENKLDGLKLLGQGPRGYSNSN